jgi:hypothetical protein
MLINNRHRNFSYRPHYTRADPTSEPIHTDTKAFHRQRIRNRHRPKKSTPVDKQRPTTQYPTYATTQGKTLHYVGLSVVCFLAPIRYLSCVCLRPRPDEPANAWP